METKETAVNNFDPRRTVLSHEQEQLVEEVIQFSEQQLEKKQQGLYLISGAAGTGKSVVLSRLFFQLQQLAGHAETVFSGTKNFFLVNHPELLKVYRQLAGQLPGVYKKQFQRPTSFINQQAKAQAQADIVLIDEGHLLTSKTDAYNHFTGNNQLESILSRARVVILVYDAQQVIKTKSYWDEQMIQRLTAHCAVRKFRLGRQFRMLGGQQVMDWIDGFSQRQEILPFPQVLENQYDFRIFTDAKEMYEKIRWQDKRVGLSRITSTINYPAAMDGKLHYVTEGRFHLPWDQYNHSSTPWAEIPETLDEVGSIYTVQGFDLNYIGVILGSSLTLDPKDATHVLVDPSLVTDHAIYQRRADLPPEKFADVLQTLFKNSLTTLLNRGRYGLYLYAHDPALRECLARLDPRKR